jgi:photosystem II stability/assembly factor-like uncharacterized protein
MKNLHFVGFLAAAVLLSTQAFATGTVSTEQLKALRFRFVGPQIGNRASAVTGVPGDPNVYYIGAASGGVWKSADGGFSFKPVFDKEPVQSIGALAVDPQRPATVWVGTGEPWVIRNGITPGDGVYRSDDGGRSWRHMGLKDAGLIARIIVNPHESDNVFVCAMGTGTLPEDSRGVWRTDNGGKTWTHVLFVNGNTGCSGMAMDPQDPRILFAGLWQWQLHPWQMVSGGPSSGLYVTRDGGNTWHQIKDHGLPHGPLGKIDVAVSRSEPERVYALIETPQQGSLWRSDDGGRHWRTENYSRLLTERAGYSVRLAVSPSDEDKIYVASNGFYVSGNGGQTFHEVHWGGDNHDIWIDPTDSSRMMISDDGGAEISTTGGRNWHHVSLPIGQMYHVSVDNRVPYWVYANMQDDDAGRGPAYPQSTPLVDPHEWQEPLGGCESGFTYPDPDDAHIIWSSCYGDEITRLDTRVGYARAVSPWPDHPLDAPPQAIKYRCHWTPPLAIDPFDHNTVYYGCQVIFKTSDGGQTWKVISPDLSTHDPEYLVPSGGIPDKGKMRRQDNLGQFYGEVVFAIAPSSVQKGLIWAGTNDGQVWLTRDGGGHWANVTRNIPFLQPWGTVTRIEPSHFSAGTVYVSVDRALMGDPRPYIYKSVDFGRSWQLIVNGIPTSPTSSVSSVAEDPYSRNLLFAGTGNTLYVSIDAGNQWTPLMAGLPHAPVSWETVQKQFHDLVVATYGRGIYVLEDITPLEQLASASAGLSPMQSLFSKLKYIFHHGSSVHVFESRPTYRFFHGTHAFIDFALSAVPKGKHPVKIEILDSQGHLVRDLKLGAQKDERKRPGLNPIYQHGEWTHNPDGQAFVGINRAFWDLRYDPPKLIKLRSTPSSNPHVWDDLRFLGKTDRPITHWGIEEAEVGPVVAPGTYTVRVTVGKKSYSQPLQVLVSPRSPENAAQIATRVKLLLHVRDDITSVTDMVNQLEWLRKQLQTVEAMLKAEKQSASKPLLKQIKQMTDNIDAVENKLLSPELANSDQKSYLDRYGLYLRLIWLNGEIGTGAGDVYGDPGYPPTDAALQVLHMLDGELDAAKGQYRDLMQKNLPQFNRTLVGDNILPLVAEQSISQAQATTSD